MRTRRWLAPHYHTEIAPALAPAGPYAVTSPSAAKPDPTPSARATPGSGVGACPRLGRIRRERERQSNFAARFTGTPSGGCLLYELLPSHGTLMAGSVSSYLPGYLPAYPDYRICTGCDEAKILPSLNSPTTTRRR